MIDWDSILEKYKDRTLFLYDDGVVHYGDFVRMVQDSAATMEKALPDEAISFNLEWKASSFADFLALMACGQSVLLEDSRTPLGLDRFPDERPLLLLRTGGTTGEPKHVVHSFQRLLLPYKAEDKDPQRILILYAANHIAGLDAFFQAIHKGATLVIPEGGDAQSIGKAIESHRVTVLPATPTYLQFLLLGGITDDHDLTGVQAIPHGAEPMPSKLRQRIREAFPNARLLHRFGMTEMGALPVRPDSNDPDAFFLDAPGYEWRIVDGEVQIKGLSPHLGTLEDGPVPAGDYWHPTGDLGELTECGSIRILGRRESIINVGGEKILPEVVESFLLDQPGVLDATVMGAEHPLTGQTVAAKVVLDADISERDFLRALRKAALANGLSLGHVPTRIQRVESIAKTRIGKRSRHQGKA